jgi:hypothetical protein
MKKALVLALLLFCLAITAGSQVFRSYALGNEEYNLLKCHSDTNELNTTLFIYVDFNDCFNCNLAFNYIIKYAPIKKNNIKIIVDNIPRSRVKAFKSEMRIPDSLQVISDQPLVNFFSALSNGVNRRSLVIKFTNGYVISYTGLTEIAKPNLLNNFVLSEVKVKNAVLLKDEKFFYTKFSQAVAINNYLVCITAPKATLIAFDTLGNFKKQVKFSDDFLVKLGAGKILARYHDSIKLSPYNSIDSIERIYNLDIKPLGFDILKLNSFVVDKDTIYVSGSITLPITTSFDKITLAPATFIFKFNKDLDLISATQYQLSLGDSNGPIDIYGFFLNNNSNEMKMAIMQFDDKVNSPYFVGTWKYSSDFYKYAGIDSSLNCRRNNTLNIYYDELKQLLYMFKAVNDSTLAFTYYPFLINTKNNSSIPLLYDSIYQYLFYKNELFQKIKYNGSNYFLCVEKVNKQLYVTLFDMEYKRVSSNIFSKKLQKKISSFLVIDNRLLGISYIDEGTELLDLEFSF